MEGSDITPIGITNFRNTNQRFGIKDHDRLQHIYVIGKSGTGKSTLLENMALSDIRRGNGLCVLDPHGDIAVDILKHIPAERKQDLIYFNATEREKPMAFNPLKGIHPKYHDLVASGLVSTFKKIWSDSWGPRMEYILRFTLLTLLCMPDATLLDIQPLLTDISFREQALSHCTDDHIQSFWHNEYVEVISNTPISLYQDVEESFLTPRGRINFSRYISLGLTTGNHHIIECDYEPLMFDNTLNRIIKYVARLLYSKSKFAETQYKLNEIIFLLDEVEDAPFNANDLNSIKLNPFFTDYQSVVDICWIVLEQQIYSNEHYEQSQWCLLFPMEYIFEDFVAGFVEAHFPEWDVKYQKSDMYLVDDPHSAFQMRHDIFLTLKTDKSKRVIVDTKYKMRDPSFKNA